MGGVELADHINFLFGLFPLSFPFFFFFFLSKVGLERLNGEGEVGFKKRLIWHDAMNYG